MKTNLMQSIFKSMVRTSASFYTLEAIAILLTILLRNEGKTHLLETFIAAFYSESRSHRQLFVTACIKVECLIQTIKAPHECYVL